MKGDKEYKWRREGMLYAYKVAQEQGLEALKKEIMIRGLWKIDIAMPKEQVDRIHDFISQNLYQTLMSTAIYSLREYSGWGKKKLHEFLKCVDKNCGNLIDLNWHGEHYVTFSDNAKELNEKFGFDFDLDRLRTLDGYEEEENAQYHRIDLEQACNFLKTEGYAEAAECLRKKIEWLRR